MSSHMRFFIWLTGSHLLYWLFGCMPWVSLPESTIWSVPPAGTRTTRLRSVSRIRRFEGTGRPCSSSLRRILAISCRSRLIPFLPSGGLPLSILMNLIVNAEVCKEQSYLFIWHWAGNLMRLSLTPGYIEFVWSRKQLHTRQRNIRQTDGRAVVDRLVASDVFTYEIF